MKSGSTFRHLMLMGAASLVLVACSDTDISSPGADTPPQAPAPSPPPPPPPPPPPTGSDFDLVPDDTVADISPNLTLVEVSVAGSTVELVEISGTITDDLTLDADTAYTLGETVFVGADTGSANGDPATLTIPAGTIFYNEGDEAGLVVSRGSQIQAVGTADAPIIFTSLAEFGRQQGLTTATGEERGEWGGIILNGFAPINDCDDDTAVGGTAGCEKSGEANSGLFGGGDSADNSGTIQYVRIEFGGIVFNGDNEANGLALQGVGSGTDIDFVQVHNNLDDAFEFFGGTVSANYLVATGAADDSIDWTDGWTGSVQFAAVDLTTIPSRDDAYGIEGDNQRPNNLTPRSAPVISNFTFFGGNHGDATNAPIAGLRLRRGTAGTYANGIVSGFNFGLDVDDEATFLGFERSGDGRLEIASHLFNNVEEIRDDGDEGFTVADIAASLVSVQTGSALATGTFVPGPANTPAVPVTVLTDPRLVETPSFIGAFAPSDTVEDNWAAGWIRENTLFPADQTAASCPTSDNIAQTGTIGDRIVCAISGVVTQDVTLGNGDDIVYRLDGTVFVGTDGGSSETNAPGSIQTTLTIEPGVTVFGDGDDDGLVVTRGSQIDADGTAEAPIVFTAGSVLRGEAADLANLRGQWGGLILNGKAPINDCDDSTGVGGTATCEKDGEASSGLFGGDVPGDSSGVLRYVQVNYGGIVFNGDNEANGIAFQGVGSGTDVEFVQVHNNLDDGLEFFGGTVSARNVVITGQADDAIDWTDGWTGRVQFAIIEGSAPGRDDAYGLEGDNQRPNDLTPRSSPTLSNLTILGVTGSGTTDGWVAGGRLRRGTAGQYYNGIFIGAPFGLDIDDQATFDGFAATGDDQLVIASHFFDSGDPIRDDGDEGFSVDDILANVTDFTDGTNTMSGFSFFGNDVGVVPGMAEAAVTATDIASIDPFFEDAPYLGAVENADDTWYLGWTIDSSGSRTTVN
ncbi:MAG: hypothetical protein AAGJ32_09640 [Pseudomonadota bacterium]